MSAKQSFEIKKSKPIWEFWYSGCLVQQIYLVLSVLGGLMLGVWSFMIFDLKVKDSDTKQNAIIIGMVRKYRWQIIGYLLSSFILSYVVNNLILVQYCNLGVKGAANVLSSLAIFFLVLPAVSWLITYLMSMLFLAELIKEARIQILPINVKY